MRMARAAGAAERGRHRGGIPHRVGRAISRRSRRSPGRSPGGAPWRASRAPSERLTSIGPGRRCRTPERPRIHTFIATSDIHLDAQASQVARRGPAPMPWTRCRYARWLCQDVEFSCEDASRSDRLPLRDRRSGHRGGGDASSISRTRSATRVPEEYGEMFRVDPEAGAERSTGAVLSAHCHNDLGLAVANSLAAIEAGARQVECTVNGIGERAGNAALEEIVMAIKTRTEHLDVDTGDAHRGDLPLQAGSLSTSPGCSVQRNKAIVGANAFAHEAGIHQDGVLKSAITYEIMTPQSVGIRHSTLVLGKHSGRHALKHATPSWGIPDAGGARPSLQGVHRDRRSEEGGVRRGTDRDPGGPDAPASRGVLSPGGVACRAPGLTSALPQPSSSGRETSDSSTPRPGTGRWTPRTGPSSGSREPWGN